MVRGWWTNEGLEAVGSATSSEPASGRTRARVRLRRPSRARPRELLKLRGAHLAIVCVPRRGFVRVRTWLRSKEAPGLERADRTQKIITLALAHEVCAERLGHASQPARATREQGLRMYGAPWERFAFAGVQTWMRRALQAYKRSRIPWHNGECIRSSGVSSTASSRSTHLHRAEQSAGCLHALDAAHSLGQARPCARTRCEQQQEAARRDAPSKGICFAPANELSSLVDGEAAVTIIVRIVGTCKHCAQHKRPSDRA